MRYYENQKSGYVTTFGIAEHGGETITEERYNALCEAIRNKPQATETTDYMLKTDLTWEAYTIEPVPEPDPTPEAIVDILTGVSE